MKYKFSELINIEEFQKLSDKFTKLTGAVTAILDLDGRILTASGWQDICTKFHRVHPRACKNCVESDTLLANNIQKGKKYHLYKCKNGLIDIAMPITIDGIHVGNMFTGQFVEDKSDKEYFKRQAKEFGFDEQAYLEAFEKVPVFSEEKIKDIMDFFLELAELVGTAGYGNKKIREALEEKEKTKKNLEMNLFLLSQAEEMIFLLDENKNLVYGNKSFYDTFQKEGKENILHNIFGKGKLIEDHDLQKVKKNGQWSGECQQKKGQEIQFYYVRMERLRYKEQNYYSVILNDISHHKMSEIDIEYFKYYDPLTKVKNSAYFWERGQEIFHNKTKEENKQGLLMVNINKFREINEVKGYAFGNKILIAFSKRLQSLKEKKDVLVRMGNDEFVILAWNINDFERFYNRLLHSYEALKKPYIIQGEEVFLSISIGISIYPNDGKDLSKLYKSGAMALGKLKNEGRSGFEFFDHELNKDVVKNYDMKVLLRKAIKEEGFILHYQPQICLDQKKIIGMEALIRLRDGDEIIMPGAFIGIAESSGLIKPIGEWVLTEACNFSNRLYQKGYEIPVSVNISRRQFEKDYIIPQISKVLRETKLPANLLQIEITEGILMENTKECIEIISKLKEIGITVSIDDFGTGYSSLEYLKKFDVDQLKIDRAFIKDVPHKDNGVIAKVVVELAESFGMDVIAEGIEKQVQEDFLVDIGCKSGQGFYYYKPMEGKKLETLLRSMYNGENRG